MTEKDTFLEFIETGLLQLGLHKEICIICEVNEIMIDLHDKIISHCNILKKVISEKNLATNYIRQFQNDLNQALNCLPYRQHQNLDFIQPQNKESIKTGIENQILPLENQLKLLQFNFDFFTKLNFFKKINLKIKTIS